MVITLVGYRATGKSTVARELAGRLGARSVDADAVIEQRAGCTIREIFANQGEPAFRSMEQVVLAELLGKHDLVIAAGGGAVLHEPTRRRMREAGEVVWLQASLETIVQRLAEDATTADRRPSLTALSLRDEVARLLAVREPLYRDAATLFVATDGRSPDAIADEIVRLLPRKDGP